MTWEVNDREYQSVCLPCPLRGGTSTSSSARLARRGVEGEAPQAIDIDEWIEGWIPQLHDEGFRIGVFQTPDDQGVGVSPERLRHDLEEELSLYGA